MDILKSLKQREIRCDPAGDGQYAASRDGGKRSHNGVDFCCHEGEEVPSNVQGTVTKHGYCYGNDLSWRYVQVTDDNGLHHRMFYVMPTARIGQEVDTQTQIGLAQGISKRYPGRGMKDHIHYEVMDDHGDYTDPMEFVR